MKENPFTFWFVFGEQQEPLNLHCELQRATTQRVLGGDNTSTDKDSGALALKNRNHIERHQLCGGTNQRRGAALWPRLCLTAPPPTTTTSLPSSSFSTDDSRCPCLSNSFHNQQRRRLAGDPANSHNKLSAELSAALSGAQTLPRPDEITANTCVCVRRYADVHLV